MSSSLSWHHRPVFIYGTLKMGQPNNSILQTAINKSQAKFLGRATTVDCWPLIVYSTFNIPFLLDCKGTGKVSIFLSYHTGNQRVGFPLPSNRQHQGCDDCLEVRGENTVNPRINAPGIYSYNISEPPAFIRDPAFIKSCCIGPLRKNLCSCLLVTATNVQPDVMQGIVT